MNRTAVIGDVHGDHDRLMELVANLDPEVHLVAVGDYFDRWDQALEVVHWLMSRPNTTALLGNHDALILGVLEEQLEGRNRLTENWLWNGGDRSDLERLKGDPDVVQWVRERPAMTLVGDTLVQHCDSPVYLNYGRTVEDINAAVRRRMASPDPGVKLQAFEDLCRRREFYSPKILNAYLGALGARRLVHGHTPHTGEEAKTLFRGSIINVDGALSRGFGPGRRGFIHWLPGEVS